ncbi:hypothetical protein HID58_065034, partial [Brassica napus]
RRKIQTDEGRGLMASPPTCLRRQKKDRNPPPIDESLGTDGVSSDLSRLPSQKNDQNPSQSTTLSVITASCPLVLVFSDVRRLYQSSWRLLLRRAMSSVWRSASALFLLIFQDLSKHMLHRQLKQLDSNEESSLSSSADMEKNINDLKGKDLLKRLHEVGTLAQISSIQGDQVILVGHRRLRITEKVSEEPLTVKVDHLKDKPFDMDDDVIKATSFEVISTLRDVHKRLRLTLELMKKEREISKIQETIAKAIEEKISGEQCRYLLNEQLKAIKKELGVETDDKSALSGEY